MSNNARLLRVLLVDDTHYGTIGTPEDGTLGTRDLELLKFPDYKSEKMKDCLMRWEDHMAFWMNPEAINRPELIIIDCNFGEDKEAPLIPVPTSGKNPPDPRGLFHGTLQVARLLGMEPWAPFGFAIYSQYFSQMAEDDDPYVLTYALTFFGLLEAMAGKIPDDKPEDIKQLLKKKIMSVEYSGPPNTAWPRALQGFRERLLDAFINGRVMADIHSFQTLKNKLEAFCEGKAEMPQDDITITWDSNWGPDHVFARSLFADCRQGKRWDAKKIIETDVVKWLDSVIKRGDMYKTIARPVFDWIDEYVQFEKNKPPFELEESEGLSAPPKLIDKYRALALTIIWAVQYTLSPDSPDSWKLRKPTILLNTLRDRLDVTQSTRAIQKGLDLKGWSLRIFISYIERLPKGEDCWPLPLPSWVHSCVYRYLHEDLKEHPDFKNKNEIQIDELPLCFQEQSIRGHYE